MTCSDVPRRWSTETLDELRAGGRQGVERVVFWLGRIATPIGATPSSTKRTYRAAGGGAIISASRPRL